MISIFNKLTVGLFLVVVIFMSEITAVHARTLEVGPDKEFVSPSVAAKFAEDGDVIEIEASGNYLNDYAVWNQNNITLKGVNGRPHLRSVGMIPNGKGVWVIKGSGVKVSNIEISGARVRDHNGAAIRLEGENFKLSDCFIHGNENGVLAGMSQPDSEVLIEGCEFAFNGEGTAGRGHNIYIGDVGRFIFRNSHSHDAMLGHLVKSRARVTYILYNRLFEGTSSYSVDLPSGGYGVVMGNVIYQGDSTDNSAMVSHGAEGLRPEGNRLEVVYNSFLNDRGNGGVFVKVAKGVDVAISNNIFSGQGEVLQDYEKVKSFKGRVKSIIKSLLFAENEAPAPEPMLEGMIKVENNVQEMDLFERFSESAVLPKKSFYSDLVDAAKSVRDFKGEELLPLSQMMSNKVVPREQLGKGLDIGAVEYR